jgi:hypothetical protein
MGLDMYLRANEYVSRNDWTRNDNGELVDSPNSLFTQIVETLELEDIIDKTGFAGMSIDLPMGYWRKANQIHNWFVTNLADGVDECQVITVRREDLEHLKELCIEVLANKSLAEDLLPTGAGFFFGSTTYDEYYYGDLEETIKIIDRCLASKFDSFEYQSSW